MESPSLKRLELSLLGLAVIAPFIGIYPIFVMKLLCFAIFAAAFNFLFGFTRLLSFGHAAFFGIAAYTTALCRLRLNLTPELAIVAGIIVSALFGLIIGILASRRKGIYFAMITLALAQCVYFFCLQVPITGGENGLQGIPRGMLFGVISLQSDLLMYYLVLIITLVVYFFIQRIVSSPFGQIVKAIGDHELRAVSLGYDVTYYKILAFVLSAAIAGVGGGLKSLVLGLATLSDVHQSTSGEVILMTLLGGTGTLLGPIIGSGIIITLQEYLSSKVGSWVSVLIGGIFVICVMIFRKGIIGELRHYLSKKSQNEK
jgi:branched-chain amino acid transport system permease protein